MRVELILMRDWTSPGSTSWHKLHSGYHLAWKDWKPWEIEITFPGGGKVRKMAAFIKFWKSRGRLNKFGKSRQWLIQKKTHPAVSAGSPPGHLDLVSPQSQTEMEKKAVSCGVVQFEHTRLQVQWGINDTSCTQSQWELTHTTQFSSKKSKGTGVPPPTWKMNCPCGSHEKQWKWKFLKVGKNIFVCGTGIKAQHQWTTYIKFLVSRFRLVSSWTWQWLALCAFKDFVLLLLSTAVVLSQNS